MSIFFNNSSINDWYYETSNLVKVYKGGALCFYKVSGTPPSPTSQTPCFAVVDDISQYSDTEFEDVFNNADGKWYKLNNLNQYEEYGVYGSGRTITTYEGKLTIDGDYEYIYSGNSWSNLGEISGSSRLPQGYTEVEYIQNYLSTASSTSYLSYLNTNVTPTQNTRTVVDLRIDKETRNPRLLGNGRWNSLGYILNCEEYVGSNGLLYYKFGQTSSWYQTSVSVDMERHVYDFNNNGQLLVDNTSIATLPSTTFTCVYPMGIFTATREENDLVDLNETIYGTLYSCQIYDNDTLVRDFVPCINPSNVVGVYDVVNDVFYGSANGNSFLAGSASSGSKIVYPMYYDEKSAPPNNLSFSSMTEAEEYECPWVGMQATIDGDRYIFSGDSTSGYEWVYQAPPYTELQWIEMPKTSPYCAVQLVDTYSACTHLYYEFTIMFNSLNDTRIIGFNSNNSYMIGYNGSTIYLNINSSRKFTISDFATNTVYHFGLGYKNGSNVFENLGTSSTYSSYHGDLPKTEKPYFGAFKSNGTLYVNGDSERIYSIKVYDNGVLVGDYIPVKRNSDDFVTLYDKITEQYCDTVGGGEMVAS